MLVRFPPTELKREEGVNFYIKRTRCSSFLIGVKKEVLRCSVTKYPQQGRPRCLVGYNEQLILASTEIYDNGV